MIHIINKKALTFDDVLISPQYSKISPNKINLKTQLTKKIFLNIPILSAAMDTVTESKLAIALAKEGGIGFIHKNMSTKKQIQEIKRVKNYTNHKNDKIITNPKCVFPSTKILEIKKFIYHNGFFSYPVINKKNELIGIITKRDISHATNLNQKVSSIMTPKNRLITTQKNEDLKFIRKKMYEKKIEKILVINKKHHLLGMITKRDLTHPHKNACKDKYGYLRVGAAISIETTTKHIKTLIEEGVDVLLIDSSHGHSKKVLQLILKIRSKYPTAQIIGGNIATKNAAIDLMKAGVDAVKVGIGPGSICTTRIVTGVGVPQITAISDVAKALKGTNIPVIADGGIRYSGDIAKAIAAGATCVMLGYILAGTKESPGKIKTHKGYSYKSYRGMGSINAMYKGSSDRYYQSNKTIHQLVPEGVEGKIPYKGELKNVLHQQIGGLRSCMRLTGCATIDDLQKKAKFIIISQAGIKENHTHGIMK
ncbi:Inosine-5'-monophosphate dehydrogenase [Candidatus Westeberhardia cardiocondylae]|uniref:Inosine-5'-monophosphate dehydrogenase n=1 Tax=Candidatus Westeberhardia cardiocondylae TaxID=1594731 RepID=A0A0H5BWK8_9ENTR|nr:IMP dehydrogenase [Candidatus Westeberhardia cardiocondylae]CEN32090.1 Inosine-5'-monophosphate dehydrogenase [Candidatus Westeberhardia cardiocondylae]